MAEYLKSNGVPEKDIFLENYAQYTRQNLEFSAGIVKRLRYGTESNNGRTGIITGGFHIPRTRMIAENILAFSGEPLCYFPAYGTHTGLDNWYKDEYGKAIVLAELRKYVRRSYANE